jgi:hypothetical protein
MGRRACPSQTLMQCGGGAAAVARSSRLRFGSIGGGPTPMIGPGPRSIRLGAAVPDADGGSTCCGTSAAILGDWRDGCCRTGGTTPASRKNARFSYLARRNGLRTRRLASLLPASIGGRRLSAAAQSPSHTAAARTLPTRTNATNHSLFHVSNRIDLVRLMCVPMSRWTPTIGAIGSQRCTANQRA